MLKKSKDICESPFECFLTSLKAASSLFGIDRKNKMKILIKIFLTRKDNQLYFCPILFELRLGINNLMEHMMNILRKVLLVLRIIEIRRNISYSLR